MGVKFCQLIIQYMYKLLKVLKTLSVVVSNIPGEVSLNLCVGSMSSLPVPKMIHHHVKWWGQDIRDIEAILTFGMETLGDGYDDNQTWSKDHQRQFQHLWGCP